MSEHETKSKKILLDDEKPKKMELEGTVSEKLPNNLFIVRLDDNGLEVLAHVSGRMKMNCINILPRDKVKVELNPNDKTKDGRFRAKIVFRAK
jgi:translation initiation factor IF-1